MSKDDLMDNNPGSPLIDVEALSDEGESTQSQKLCTDQAEDQRVLTLAEQFLAAMPARIKNDQGEKRSPGGLVVARLLTMPWVCSSIPVSSTIYHQKNPL